MAGPLGWLISAHSISDWVTPFRTSCYSSVSFRFFISITSPAGTHMIEFVGDWCYARHSMLVDRTLEVVRRIAIPLPLLLNSHCYAGHSTLVERTL